MNINGPNLNFLGTREPHIYGYTTLDDLNAGCQAYTDHMGADLTCHQTSFEGAMIELIQSARENCDALIINPAGYSFTSVSVVDELKIVEKPIIELHISNNYARDELHKRSVVSGAVTGACAGSATTATSWRCSGRCTGLASCRTTRRRHCGLSSGAAGAQLTQAIQRWIGLH